MTLQEYLQARQERLRNAPVPRPRCGACKKPRATCYCSFIEPFVSATKFVILIHRDEVRRSVATGRMAHLCLSNSSFFEGLDFSFHDEVNAIIQDPTLYPVVLYPGVASTNLSRIPPSERWTILPANKQLVVFVIDGTWAQARRIKRLSTNLNRLPFVCFTPPTPSAFKVRKQPHPGCYSTIEAIHHFIDLVGTTSREHDSLLGVFNFMVEQQLGYETKFGAVRGFRSLRGKRPAVDLKPRVVGDG